MNKQYKNSVRVDVYNILLYHPKARDDVNICITKYFLNKRIRTVRPEIWGRADTVRREWRYWINTKKAFSTVNENARFLKELEHRAYYGEKI